MRTALFTYTIFCGCQPFTPPRGFISLPYAFGLVTTGLICLFGHTRLVLYRFSCRFTSRLYRFTRTCVCSNTGLPRGSLFSFVFYTHRACTAQFRYVYIVPGLFTFGLRYTLRPFTFHQFALHTISCVHALFHTPGYPLPCGCSVSLPAFGYARFTYALPVSRLPLPFLHACTGSLVYAAHRARASRFLLPHAFSYLRLGSRVPDLPAHTHLLRFGSARRTRFVWLLEHTHASLRCFPRMPAVPHFLTDHGSPTPLPRHTHAHTAFTTSPRTTAHTYALLVSVALLFHCLPGPIHRTARHRFCTHAGSTHLPAVLPRTRTPPRTLCTTRTRATLALVSPLP